MRRHEEGVAARDEELRGVEHHGDLALQHHEDQRVGLGGGETLLGGGLEAGQGGAVLRRGEEGSVLHRVRAGEGGRRRDDGWMDGWRER